MRAEVLYRCTVGAEPRKPEEVAQDYDLPGTHPGILIIRFDNDPTRDMTPRHIVMAIAHLASAGIPLKNQVYILNHWRSLSKRPDCA